MYRTCLFCAADLGTNEVLEAFPVGRLLAYDAWKGRLWAVCPRCARWNLAPIEERWETIESAEVRFRAAPLRVHSENVGLAKLPDGTGLIRIGEALPGELAAWRYGDQLRRRRVRHWVQSGGEFLLGNGPLAAAVLAPTALGVALPALFAGVSTLGAISVGAALGIASNLPQRWIWRRRGERVLLRVTRPDADPVVIRAADAIGARLDVAEDGRLRVRLEMEPLDEIRRVTRWMTGITLMHTPITVMGDPGRRLLGRLLVGVNRTGATRSQVAASLAELDLAGGSETFLHRIAERRPGVGGRRDRRPKSAAPLLRAPEALAFELALHEETERHALEGELRSLRSAWAEAEEIAAIADSLLDSPSSS